jgi:hypothetical protein
MWPHERSLVKKLADKPFALIGVNVNGYKPDKLKDVMDKEKLNWRSFADPGGFTSGISSKWNLQGTPTVYILDHKGVIRHKWLGGPGDKTIDEALEKLIKEAERGKDASK